MSDCVVSSNIPVLLHSPAYLRTHATPLLLAPLGKTSTCTMHFTTTHAVGHALGSWPGIVKLSETRRKQRVKCAVLERWFGRFMT